MNNQRFRVIKGGGKKTSYIPRHHFKRAYATNTRLMGVIGLIAYWEKEDGEEYVQLYHLDYEEYGIDGFDSITNGEPEEVKNVRARMMEGLGGKFKKISKKETCYLLKKCYDINIKNRDINPTGFDEYHYLIGEDVSLDKEERDKLWIKLCESLSNDNQLINYYMMRSVAIDLQGKNYLGSEKATVNFNPTLNPSMLIKNKIELLGEEEGVRHYDVESLIDFDKGYKLIMARFEVADFEERSMVTGSEIVNSMNISSLEATFNLKRPEYLLLYDITTELEEFLDEFNPLMTGAMQNAHRRGFLYTKFNSNNDHVKNNTYFLNGDIYAVYYVTEGKQLAIGTYVEENIKDIKRIFAKAPFNKLVEYESEYKSENQILYEFVHSNFTNFLDFISAD